MKNSVLNKKPASLVTKVQLKAEQDKTVKLQAIDSSYFWRWWHAKLFSVSASL